MDPGQSLVGRRGRSLRYSVEPFKRSARGKGPDRQAGKTGLSTEKTPPTIDRTLEPPNVDEHETSTIDEPSDPTPGATDLPPGSHALEVAARSGLGPLSTMGREVWHGRARPCVSCGQLIPRGVVECEHCGQDHSLPMLEKMQLHAGPWYVLEHIRPFPGVSLERIVMQIRRGLITETSIVRGPSTSHQWRFAVEAPGLCRYFERCWRCHDRISQAHESCPKCEANLGFDPPAARPKPASQSEPQPVLEAPVAATRLAGLSAAVERANPAVDEDLWDAPPRLVGIRATWIVALALILVMVVLIWVTQFRASNTQTSIAPVPATQRTGT